MASAIVGGLRRAGFPAEDLLVVEPFEAQRERLAADFGIRPRRPAITDSCSAPPHRWRRMSAARCSCR